MPLKLSNAIVSKKLKTTYQKMEIEKKIVKAIETGRLSLKNEGEKFWFHYKLSITKLFWSRNLFDGYQIDVYDKFSGIHLETVNYGR